MKVKFQGENNLILIFRIVVKKELQCFLTEAVEEELIISMSREFRSLIENRKLFNVSPTERQTKCMRVSRIICVNLTV